MSKLDKDSPMPLWYQVKESILEKIEQGAYSEEKPLPSEKQLCNEFEVSVITIRKAMDELTKEGLLEKKQGKGTFLNLKKFERELNTFYGFSKDILKKGAIPTRKVLSFNIKKPAGNIGGKLNIDNFDDIYEIRTLTLANDIPIIISKFYIQAEKIPGFKSIELAENSIYTILQEHYNLKLKTEVWNIEAVILDEYEAQLLNVPVGSPALLHESTSYNLNNEVVMFAKGILRGDKCKFSITLSDEKTRQSSLLLAE